MASSVFRTAAAVLAVALVSACIDRRAMILAPAPADLFDSSSPVEVTGTHVVVNRHGHVVAGSGEGAGAGFLAGVGGSVGAGIQSGNTGVAILGILLAPAAGVGGALYGAAAAHPAEETEAAIAAIERVYDDDSLLGAVAPSIRHRMSGLGFSTLPPCGAPEGSAIGASEDCRPVTANRLRLTVSYAFSTQGALSPALQFAMEATATAANSDPAREAQAFRWTYLSPKHDFFQATGGDARELRAAIAEVQKHLADQIVDDLFLARREVTIDGLYHPNRKGINFEPAPRKPGVIVRVPTQSELVEVPEEALAR